MLAEYTGGKIIASKEAARNSQDEFLPFWFLFSCILDLGFTFTLLQLTKIMRTAITQKAKSTPSKKMPNCHCERSQ